MGKAVLLPFGDREHIDRLLRELEELTARGQEEEFALVLPSRQLLHRYRDRLVKKASRRLNLVTFDELVAGALATLPARIEAIAAPVAFEIIVGILRRRAKELSVFSRANPRDVAADLVYVLGQLRRGGKRPADLTVAAGEDKTLADLALLWRQYEDFLRRGKLADLEEQYLVAKSAVPHIPWLARVRQLHFCWFFDFEPLQLGIIDALAGMGIEITFWLPYDHRAHEAHLGQTLKSLAQRGFPCEKRTAKGSGGLAASLYLQPTQPASMPPVKGLGAQRIEQELELVAEEIKILAARGAKAEDICLVIPPQKQYREKLVAVFKGQRIDLSLARSIELSGVPWVRELVKVWRGACAGWDAASLLRVAGNVYILPDLPEDYDSASFSRVLSGLGSALKGRSLAAKVAGAGERLVQATKMAGGESADPQGEGKALLYKKAEEAVNAWLAFTAVVADKRSCRDHCRVLQDLLEANEGRICSQGDGPLAVRDHLALIRLKECLEDYLASRRLLGRDGQVSAEEFLEGLLPWLRQPLTIYRSRPGGVQVMSAAEIRGLRFPWVFIVGLNQGVFPQAGQGHWLLERAGAREAHKTLAREKLYFHNAVAATEKGLFLSRLLPGIEEGAETSAFWRETEAASQSLPVRYLSSADFLPPAARAGSPGKLKGRLVYDLVRGIETPAHSRDWLRSEKDYPQLFIAGETIRGRESPRPADNFDGVLAVSEFPLKAMFGGATYSVSRLEQYGRCPFAFFLRYCLAVRPADREDEYSPLEKGLLLHRLLEGFYRQGYSAGAWSDRPATIVGPLMKLAEEWLAEKGFDGGELVWRLRLAEAVGQVAALIGVDLVRQRETGFRPLLFEAEFGPPAAAFTPGRGIYFRGRIDRVDIRTEQDRTLAVVYDYKSSREVAKGKILAGKSLQIPVYLEAARQLLEDLGYKGVKLVGGGYYVIKKGKLAGGIWDKEYLQLVKHSLGSVPGEEFGALKENLAQVSYDRHRAIITGEFAPNPEENACRYCDYADCCRYDKYRFQLKGGVAE